MSSTRKAETGSPLRQERYASDPAFNDYLKASAVARKCGLFNDPAHKELCLYLQYVSMQPGGLAAFAADFLKRYSDRIGSKTMRKHTSSTIFDAAIVRSVRDELGLDNIFNIRFPLKGEVEATLDDIHYDPLDRFSGEYDDRQNEKIWKASTHPINYPAQDFMDYCMEHAEDGLEAWLTDFCLDPATTFANPPRWFHEIERSLVDFIKDRRADGRAGMVVTTIGEQINDALDYAWEEKCLIHINGVARMGKTFQLRQWCAAYPGRVRYMQVPSGNDDISFFRAIARALGTAAGSAMKTTQIKRNIEDAIQDTGIMLVLDEAHYLFPQYKDVRSSPRRINWLLTEVVNKGIPAAIVSTPQFDVTQKAVVSGTGWASEQLDGRIAYRLDLPDELPDQDLISIAKLYFPDASEEVTTILNWYAERSNKYLAGIEAVSKRARYLARKAGRTGPNGADLKASMTQVDPVVAQFLNQEQDPQDECKPPAKPKKPVCKPAAQPVQTSGKKILVPA